MDDGPQVRDEALAVRAGLELVLSSRMNTVTRMPRPAAACSDGWMPRTRFATLGARTPEETAVSIAAEIIARVHQGTGRPLTRLSGPIHRLPRPTSYR